MTSQTFWMVLGVGTPTYKHTTKSSACKEAERLAMQCPGDEFTVLQSVGSVVKRDVSWVQHIDISKDDEGNDVPF